MSVFICFGLLLFAGCSGHFNLPQQFIAAGDRQMLMIDEVTNRASTLNDDGQLIGLDCSTVNETSLFLGSGSPCVVSVLDGQACPGSKNHGTSACEILRAWSDISKQGTLVGLCRSFSNATVCFTSDGVIQSFQMNEISLSFSGWLPGMQAPDSGYVFPSFLCKCGNKHVKRISNSVASTQAISFVASVRSLSPPTDDAIVFFVDTVLDRATFWDLENQPIGINCSSASQTTYSIALNSSCVSSVIDGVPCANAGSNPCQHVLAFKAFAKVTGFGTQCVSTQTRLGESTLCLTFPNTFLNYSAPDGSKYKFVGETIRVQAPNSVYPFVPAADCPCS